MRIVFNCMMKLKWWLILPIALLLVLGWGKEALTPSPDDAHLNDAHLRDAHSFGFVPSPTPSSTPFLLPSPTPIFTILPPPTWTPTSTPTPKSTDTPTPSPTPSPSPSPSATTPYSPDQTPTPEQTVIITPTTTPSPASTHEATSTEVETAAHHPQTAPLVLANYFPWYDPSTWETGCTSAGDTPQGGGYQSDDAGVIARHIGQAQAAGLDGFAVHWFAPHDRTDANFAQVLNQSPSAFNSTVTFLHHILPGVNQQGVVDALRHIIHTHSGHARFFRVGGKAVIMFSDMYRVPDAGGSRPTSDQDTATAIARWAAIRQAVDPGHEIWWIAEGLKPDYLAVFDGLYVYKIDHACCPNAYASASRWAEWVRDWERQSGQPKLWVGTVMPGWNDMNSAHSHCVDLRVSSAPFGRDRADGAYYARTWEAVLPTRPDFIMLHSFNEWVEGSYIEPSAHFGDLYLQLTAQWAARYKGGQ